MPRACSADLRERVLAAYEAGEGSQAEVAGRFRVAERTLARWLQAARTEGRRGPKAPGRRRAPLSGQTAALAALVAEQGDATLSEYAERLAARTGVRRSLAAVCRALKAPGLVRKTSRSGPPSRTGRMSPRHGPHGAPNWRGSTRAGSSSSTLGSGAAEGIDTRLTRTYARAARGRRATGTVPWSRWERLTVLGALGFDGVVAAMSVAAATGTAVFLAFVEQVLVPAPEERPGAIVVMDTGRRRRPGPRTRPRRSAERSTGPGSAIGTCRPTRRT